MYLGDRANEQANVILKSAEATMKRMMDLAIEHDCATLMYESQRIAGDIAILRTALLGRDDLVSITDTFDCFGDPTDKSVEEIEDEEDEEYRRELRDLHDRITSQLEDSCNYEGCPFSDEFDDDDDFYDEEYDIAGALQIIGSSLGEILNILKGEKKADANVNNNKPKSNPKSTKVKGTNKEDSIK